MAGFLRGRAAKKIQTAACHVPSSCMDTTRGWTSALRGARATVLGEGSTNHQPTSTLRRTHIEKPAASRRGGKGGQQSFRATC
jgi:hypothetical protein